MGFFILHVFNLNEVSFISIGKNFIRLGIIVDLSSSYVVGPENWSKIYKECDGKRQSPINIDTKNVLKNGNLTLKFGSTWKNKSKLKKRRTRLIISNGGHAVELVIKTQVQDALNPIFTYEGG